MTTHSYKNVSMGLLILIAAFLLSGAERQGTSPARLIRTIPAPDIKGRIDHMASDPAGKRLFVAALGNNSVEVIDTAEGKIVKSIRGLKEPQAVLIVPEQNLLFVTNGGAGTLLKFPPFETCDLVDAIYKSKNNKE